MSYKGKRVRHKTFGDGTVNSENGPVLYVNFDNIPGTHTFIANGCFQMDLELIPGQGTVKPSTQKNPKKAGKASPGSAGSPKTAGKSTGKSINTAWSSVKSVPEFCDICTKALQREIFFLKNNGGKTYRITNGQKIEKTYFRQNVYIFETDIDFNFPDGQQIKLIWYGQEYPATVVSCGDGKIIFSTDYYFGSEVKTMELQAEPWQLLQTLCDRLSEIRSSATHLTEQLICDGKDHINYKGNPLTGQNNALSMAKTQAITFIWGPPGTGKTETLASIVLEALDRKESVLMLSYSNVSVDGAILRVYDLYQRKKGKNIQPGIAIRYGYPKNAEVLNHPTMTAFNLALSGNKELETERKNLLKKLEHLSHNSKEYVETIDQLSKIRKKLENEEKEIAGKANFLATTVSKAVVDATIYDKKFDMVIFDEASMAYIPQIIFASSLAKKHFVCLGDFCQLPPIVQSDNKSALNNDIFEYCGIVKAVDSNAGHEWLCLLDTQYRMHPKIAEFVSEKMYHSLLRSGPKMENLRKEITKLEPASGSPVVLADLSGMMTVCSKTSDNSRINLLSALFSAAMAVNAAEKYEVGIITPYNAQARLLRAIIRDIGKNANHKITCATVHQFQGSEQDVIIYDAVECYRMNHPGVLLSSTKNNYANRLFNVAMTRARGKFIAVANRDFMVEKKLSKELLFRNLLDDLKDTPHCTEGEELVEGNNCLDQVFLNKKIKIKKEFLSDLESAYDSVYIDLPASVDQASVNALIQTLTDLVKKGIKVHIRSNDRSVLPQKLQELTNETKIPVYNPIAIIDRQIVWFGMPNSLDHFQTVNGTLKTRYRPAARIIGKQTASALFNFFELEKDNPSVVQGAAPHAKITIRDVRPEQTFSEYIDNEYMCKHCGSSFEVVLNKEYVFRCNECGRTIKITEKVVNDYLWSESKNGTFCPECHTSLEAREGKNGNIYIICNNNGKKHIFSLNDFE